MPRIICIWPEGDTAGEPGAAGADLLRCAGATRRFSPFVGLIENRAVVLDTGGPAHPDALRAGAVDGIRRCFPGARAAPADTIGAAYALAGWGRTDAAGAWRSGLLGLPVEALRLGSPAQRAVERAGLRSIGDICGHSLAALEDRLGSAGLVEWVRRRADQALGRRAEAFPALEPAPRFLVRQAVEGVRDGRAVRVGLHRALHDLEWRMDAEDWGARRLVVRVFGAGNDAATTSASVRNPTRAPRTWLEVLDVDGLVRRTRFAPELVLVEAHRCGPMPEVEAPATDAFAPEFTTIGAVARRMLARLTLEAAPAA